MSAKVKRTIVVLLVDDYSAVRTMCAAILRGSFDVISAASAEEALATAESHKGRIDLLLSDVDMPGMNGVELARRIQLQRPETMVLLMSGLEDESIMSDERRHFIGKPFTARDLVAKIEAVLAQRCV